MTDTDKRAAYIEGLHQIADFLAEHPEVPLPHLYSRVGNEWGPALFIYLLGEESQREKLAEVARAMGRVEKSTEDYGGGIYQISRKFGGIQLAATASRDEVCERVVTGTREVTEEVPDPEALAAVPKVTVTTVVEDVEWVCQPLLAKPSTSLLAVPAEVA